MITEISTSEFQADIREHLGIDLEFDLPNLFKFDLDGIIHYGISVHSGFEGYPSLLVAQIDTAFTLFPGILPYILNLPIINLQRKACITLSFGRPIEFAYSKGLYLVQDGENHVISLVSSDGTSLNPLVDLGMYLRYESADS
ncbi:MAG: hypothetical protein ACXAE3_17770 [Candidatus Kariarchaeaceae archaeon]|jgi:hypothetical protein